MAVRTMASQTESGVLDVYVMDPLPGLKLHHVRVAPSGCLQFLTSRVTAVRWHNVTSWGWMWIVKIAPDPDYLCCPDAYPDPRPYGQVPGAPAFADFGPVLARGSRTMSLRGFKPGPLHYRYDIVAADVPRKPTVKDGRCGVEGWDQDPHFVLQ